MLLARVTRVGQVFEIDQIGEGSENGAFFFLLQSKSDPGLNIRVNYKLPVHKGYELREFDCHPFFTNAYFKENNIYELHESSIKERLGWIFPVQSLISTAHDKADNVHFLKYAYITFLHLLNGEIFKSDLEFTVNTEDEEIGLEDIYKSSLIIVSLSNQKTRKISNFNIKNFLPSLFNNRYYLCNDLSQVDGIVDIGEDRTVQNVWIKQNSKYISKNEFIAAIYIEHLIQASHPLVHFHLLYQIIEILIDRILDFEIEGIVTTFRSSKKSAYDLKKEIQEISPEEKRISKLFSTYLVPAVNNNNFVASCNWILTRLDKETLDLSLALYQTRNKIVHRFRDVVKIDSSNLEKMKEINEDFNVLVCDILAAYSEPIVLAKEPSGKRAKKRTLLWRRRSYKKRK